MFYVRSIGVIRTCVLEVQGKRSTEVKGREGKWGVGWGMGGKWKEGRGREGEEGERKGEAGEYVHSHQ